MINTIPSDSLQKALTYPKFRYMGSKHKLLPWIYEVTSGIQFDSALDAFSGSGAVSYLLKSMGKSVHSNDFLNFASTIASGLIVNSSQTLDEEEVHFLGKEHSVQYKSFIRDTFSGIFFSQEDLRYLDIASQNILDLPSSERQNFAMTCLIRSCLKKQPRGVFTVSGDLSNYNDGRRDLKLSIQEHFEEQVQILSQLIFDSGRVHKSSYGSIFDLADIKPDLVYLDPPYVPNSDDNCYVKRYHFVEGLSKYWDGEKILESSKVKKIEKKYTPFSYRKTALEAFDQLFSQFQESTLVLSYSSNAFPNLQQLTSLMRGYKPKIEVHQKDHRYHFGTHKNAKRNIVEEYLIIGRS